MKYTARRVTAAGIFVKRRLPLLDVGGREVVGYFHIAFRGTDGDSDVMAGVPTQRRQEGDVNVSEEQRK